MEIRDIRKRTIKLQRLSLVLGFTGFALLISLTLLPQSCRQRTPGPSSAYTPLEQVAEWNALLAHAVHQATVTTKNLASVGWIGPEDAGRVLTMTARLDAIGIRVTETLAKASTLDGPTADALSQLFQQAASEATTLATTGNLFVKNPKHKAEVITAVNLIASTASTIVQGLQAFRSPSPAAGPGGKP